MKIITIHQPFALLFLLGLKVHETRGWQSSYRGPVLLHAARKRITPDRRERLLDLVARAHRAGRIPRDVSPGVILEAAKRLRGRVIGHANLTDVSRAGSVRARACELDVASGDWQESDENPRYVHRMEDVRAVLPSIPWKGRQGFYLPAPGALAALAADRLVKLDPAGICAAAHSL